MSWIRHYTLELYWLLLLLLTLGSGWIGESGRPGLGVGLFVVLTIALKGRVVIDQFMELKHSNRVLRRAMRLYFVVMPVVVLLVYLYGL